MIRTGPPELFKASWDLLGPPWRAKNMIFVLVFFLFETVNDYFNFSVTENQQTYRLQTEIQKNLRKLEVFWGYVLGVFG